MRSRSKPVSQRQLRVAEQIRHLLAGAFQKGDVPADLLDLPFLSVMEVRISSDFSYCKVYVLPFDIRTVDMTAVVKRLNEQAKYFRTMIGRNIRLRVTPEVKFFADETEQVASRIDDLLNSPAVKRDLTPVSDETENDSHEA